MRKFLFPSPLLSISIFILWLILNRSVVPFHILAAVFLALVVPIFTAKLRPNTVKISNPLKAIKLLGIVFFDMLKSNIQVIKCILFKRGQINSAFVRVPLELRDPNALAVLAVILCFTPGTAWAEISFDRSVLLVHVLNLKDEDNFIEFVKTRYEQPLLEIFK